MLTSKGNLNQEIEITSRDELGNLAKSFSHMRDAVRDTIRNLEAAEKG